MRENYNNIGFSAILEIYYEFEQCLETFANWSEEKVRKFFLNGRNMLGNSKI